MTGMFLAFVVLGCIPVAITFAVTTLGGLIMLPVLAMYLMFLREVKRYSES